MSTVAEWSPEAYPQLTTAMIPYTSAATSRPDPYITITESGWLFIEVGNVRLACPGPEEWDKLVAMVAEMWEAWRVNQQFSTPTFVDDTSPDGGPAEGDNDDHSGEADGSDPGTGAPSVSEP